MIERYVTAAVGSAAIGSPGAGSEVVLDLGARHPSSHGLLRLRLAVGEDGVIDSAEPLVGAMHRGAEKLFEVRDYRQVLVLANRHDWLSAFGSELALALAVERMVGIEVPARAVWARMALAELNRIVHHLQFAGAVPGAGAAAYSAAREGREATRDVLELVSGGRVHFMLNQVGGLKVDLPAGWRDQARAAVGVVRRVLPAVRHATVDDDRVAASLRGVGVLSPDAVLAYGVSGPAARASGVAIDLRRDDPYLAYGELEVPVSGESAGDCLARTQCLLDEVAVSGDLVEQCLDRLAALPPGPINVPLPKLLRVPEGATYAWTENGSGINGYYLVSRGEPTPWRLKLRTASFNNVQALRAILPGSRVEHLVPVLASLFFVIGDVDK